jgi:CRISPR-associated protein Csb1
MTTLNLELLKKAVWGEYVAIRRITRLEPQGDKIFPPTYEGGKYATEERQVRLENGAVETVETVLLDSVQSQANRMELALLQAQRNKRIKIPFLEVDFSSGTNDPILTEIGRITALEAPHRMCDAIFRDSMHNGQRFRESELGAKAKCCQAN